MLPLGLEMELDVAKMIVRQIKACVYIYDMSTSANEILPHRLS